MKLKSQLYFDEPVVQKIDHSGFRTPAISPVNDIVDGDVSTSIRTVSCRPPGSTSFKDQWPDKVTYGCSERPSYQESHEYVERQQIHGFGKYAIVARRWAHPIRFLHGHQWGMIIQLNYVAFIHDMSPWAPYVVRWFAKESVEEKAWAEDLIVIHAALDDENLLEIAEAQSVDITAAMKHLEDQKNRAI